MKNKVVAIFAAINDEIKIIRSKMEVDEQIHLKPSLIIKGQLNNKPCILVKSGIGKKTMRQVVEYCLANLKPDICLSVGYAGGTTPEMNIGDMVIADPVIDGPSKKNFLPDSRLAEEAVMLCKQMSLKMVRGGLVTVDDVVKSPHEKAFVGTEYSAIAVDMESAVFMECCEKASCPALVVRTILDPLDIVIPDMSDVMNVAGNVSVGQLAEHVMNHPKDILSLPKIEYCAMKARESITTFIETWVAYEHEKKD